MKNELNGRRSRTRIGIGLILLVTLLALGFTLRQRMLRGRPSVLATGNPGPSADNSQAEELPDPLDNRSARDGLDASLLPQVQAPMLDEDQHLVFQYERVLALIAQLEQLAQAPKEFHARALPLVLELRALCFQGAGPAGPEPKILSTRILAEFVEVEQLETLVRAAVFLALAPHLERGSFRRIFDPWIRDRQLPRELLRVAALGAALRGSDSGCSVAIDLGDLARIPVDPNVPNPGVYPLELTSVVEDYETRAILAALLDFDPLLERVESTGALPGSESEALEAAESSMARQVLLLVLGHRSLVDPELEDLIVSIAEFTHRADGKPSVDFCAALLVTHSLCNCSESYLAMITASAHSSNPLVAGSYGMMKELGVGPVNDSLISTLYAMRWPETVREQAIMRDEISMLAERLGADVEIDSVQRAEFLGFMRELIGDVSEAEEVRMTSMYSLQATGDWDVTLLAAADVFQCVSSSMLKALAFDGLMAAAKQSEKQKQAVLEVLKSIRDSSKEAWVLDDAQSYIDELN